MEPYTSGTSALPESPREELISFAESPTTATFAGAEPDVGKLGKDS